MFIFILETETEHEQGRGRERERESEAGSRLQADSTKPNVGLEPMTCESSDHDLRWSQTLNPLSHPGALKVAHFKNLH